MATEIERHELYETAKREVSDRFAELMMSSLPPHPDRLATKDDVVVVGGQLRAEMADLRTELRTEMADLRTELRTEMADLRTELRTEMADLRTEMAHFRTELRVEMAGLRVEMRDLTNQQTRILMLGLVGSITAFAITQLVLAALG
jgi:ribosomal protein L29